MSALLISSHYYNNESYFHFLLPFLKTVANGSVCSLREQPSPPSPASHAIKNNFNCNYVLFNFCFCQIIIFFVNNPSHDMVGWRPFWTTSTHIHAHTRIQSVLNAMACRRAHSVVIKRSDHLDEMAAAANA